MIYSLVNSLLKSLIEVCHPSLNLPGKCQLYLCLLESVEQILVFFTCVKMLSTPKSALHSLEFLFSREKSESAKMEAFVEHNPRKALKKLRPLIISTTKQGSSNS